ncbi:MAG: 50S ribosomal protein L35 [Candidatus Tectomicrobia bacterium]|nr:50S ribosomal protein L35 [Candidatus Tectomicrobia bacterium]
MPKIKTKRSAAKRFKKTGTGKFLRAKAFSGHLFTKKTKKRKRNLRKSAVVSRSDERRIKELLPYL